MYNIPIMNQVKKLKNLEKLSYFDKNTLAQYIELSDNSLYANIKRWLKNGRIIQIKKGMYVTPEYYNILPNKEEYIEFLSNKIREPSYLSLEYVLQKYSMLTESVYSYTSITLKSRRVYKNKFGIFVYRKIKEDLFTGYIIKEYAGFKVKVATKAKALFDWLYLKNYRIEIINRELLNSYRLNLDEFKKRDLKEFSNYCALSGIKKYINLTKLIGDIYDI